MKLTKGTDLFDRMLAFNYEDAERADLMRKVWTQTPFMADVLTGTVCDDTYNVMQGWCYEHIGPPCRPIHGHEGDWQFGGVTIHGWTWIGFATQEQLDAFLAAFPGRLALDQDRQDGRGR